MVLTMFLFATKVFIYIYILYYTVYLVYCEASLVWFFCLLLMHGQVIAGTTPQGRTFKSCFVRGGTFDHGVKRSSMTPV